MRVLSRLGVWVWTLWDFVGGLPWGLGLNGLFGGRLWIGSLLGLVNDVYFVGWFLFSFVIAVRGVGFWCFNLLCWFELVFWL